MTLQFDAGVIGSFGPACVKLPREPKKNSMKNTNKMRCQTKLTVHTYDTNTYMAYDNETSWRNISANHQ